MLAIVIVDQVSKWLAVICLKGNESFPLWEGVFHLTYVENTGSAFGMLKDHRWVFMTISTVIILIFTFLLFKYYKKINNLLRVSVAFLIAGGVGNMIDRTLLGYVVDFFDFVLIDFAVFNVADSFVCIGAGLLCLWYILDVIREYKESKTKKTLAKCNTEELSDKSEN